MGTVRTNNRVRPLVALEDLPKAAQEDFDYVTDRFEDRFVQYLGTWHDVLDSQSIHSNESFGFRVSPNHTLYGWDAIATDSFFGGVVFRWMTDKEAFDRDLDRHDYIIVGTWTG